MLLNAFFETTNNLMHSSYVIVLVVVSGVLVVASSRSVGIFPDDSPFPDNSSNSNFPGVTGRLAAHVGRLGQGSLGCFKYDAVPLLPCLRQFQRDSRWWVGRSLIVLLRQSDERRNPSIKKSQAFCVHQDHLDCSRPRHSLHLAASASPEDDNEARALSSFLFFFLLLFL